MRMCVDHSTKVWNWFHFKMESDLPTALKTAYLYKMLSLPRKFWVLHPSSLFRVYSLPTFTDEQKESQRDERTSSEMQIINYGGLTKILLLFHVPKDLWELIQVLEQL